MKKYILVLIFMVTGFAFANPPQPRPPGPPGLPVDSGIVFLFIVSVFFAFFIINKSISRNKKFYN